MTAAASRGIAIKNIKRNLKLPSAGTLMTGYIGPCQWWQLLDEVADETLRYTVVRAVAAFSQIVKIVKNRI